MGWSIWFLRPFEAGGFKAIGWPVMAVSSITTSTEGCALSPATCSTSCEEVAGVDPWTTRKTVSAWTSTGRVSAKKSPKEQTSMDISLTGIGVIKNMKNAKYATLTLV